MSATDPRDGDAGPPLASVVIPAHNEERGIAVTLGALLDGCAPGELDVVVVCNGCTDGTAHVVRQSFPQVRLVVIDEPSKTAAVEMGNAQSTAYPRLHLDADIKISWASVQALISALESPGVHAVAPRRVLDRAGSSRLVNAYYDVWERLPQVESGLFGRGVFMLSAQGQRRVSQLPRLLSDDLAVSEAFAEHERRIVPAATAVVAIPRRTGDLLRRRVRVATGNQQATRLGARSREAVTRPSTLIAMVRFQPALVWRLPTFLLVTLVARTRAHRAVRAGDFGTWLRDESSRA